MYVLAALPIPRPLQNEIQPLQTHRSYAELLRPSRMELHVTLKAPQKINDANKDVWLNAARSACSNIEPIGLGVTCLSFITSTVLALDINPAPFQQLHTNITDKLSTFNSLGDKLHEGERFRPHITIGRSLKGPLSAAQRTEILKALKPMITYSNFSARIVRLYGREEGAYRPLLDVSL